MLKRLRELFETKDTAAARDPEARESALRLATAALLVEMARADFERSDAEDEEILRILGRHFGLDGDAAGELLAAAGEEADRAVSLHEFTQLLHASLEVEEKHHIVEMLWRVALSDAVLDKYEDYLVRKVADLLYVSHSDLMRLKHRVLGELDAGE